MKFGEKNIGEIDKAARALLGIVFLGAAAGSMVAPPMLYLAVALGLILVATAAYGSCPLYSVLGMDTRTAKGKKK